jgi:hypothetical protein
VKAEVVKWSELVISDTAKGSVVLLGHARQRLVRIETVGPNVNYAFPEEGRRHVETVSLDGKIRTSFLVHDNEYACVIREAEIT